MVIPEVKPEVGEDDYNICLEPTCDVVYYNRGRRFFRKKDLTIRVAYKQPDGHPIVCYCHNLTEDDIVDLLNRNPDASSFADVTAILGVDNCACEERHPFGGNCACAGDVGRIVKLARGNGEIHKHGQQPRLPSVFIYERNGACCGPSPSASLASFLQRRFAGQIELKKVDLAAANDSVPIAHSLLHRLCRDRAAALPAFVVDGEVVTAGHLPTLFDAVDFVDTHLKCRTPQE